MTAENDAWTEMGELSVAELLEFLAKQDETTVITGAAILPCGHWMAFFQVYGHTVILSHHCSEDQAKQLVYAASALSDVMDSVVVAQGGHVVNELHVAKEIFDIAQWPDSSDA